MVWQLGEREGQATFKVLDSQKGCTFITKEKNLFFLYIVTEQFSWTYRSDRTFIWKLFFYSIFNIWLNKIHLCKQTQDKALTKPNKQENKHRLSHSQAVGLDRLAHPLGPNSLTSRGGVSTHLPFTWAAGSHCSPPQERCWHTRKVAPKYFKTSLHIVHWSIGLQFPCKQGFSKVRLLISIENIAVEIYFPPPLLKKWLQVTSRMPAGCTSCL